MLEGPNQQGDLHSGNFVDTAVKAWGSGFTAFRDPTLNSKPKTVNPRPRGNPRQKAIRPGSPEAYIRIYIYIYLYINVYIYIYIYIHMYVCIYIYIYTCERHFWGLSHQAILSFRYK